MMRQKFVFARSIDDDASLRRYGVGEGKREWEDARRRHCSMHARCVRRHHATHRCALICDIRITPPYEPHDCNPVTGSSASAAVRQSEVPAF